MCIADRLCFHSTAKQILQVHVRRNRNLNLESGGIWNRWCSYDSLFQEIKGVLPKTTKLCSSSNARICSSITCVKKTSLDNKTQSVLLPLAVFDLTKCILKNRKTKAFFHKKNWKRKNVIWRRFLGNFESAFQKNSYESHVCVDSVCLPFWFSKWLTPQILCQNQSAIET